MASLEPVRIGGCRRERTSRSILHRQVARWVGSLPNVIKREVR